jgi:hypothetical protein
MRLQTNRAVGRLLYQSQETIESDIMDLMMSHGDESILEAKEDCPFEEDIVGKDELKHSDAEETTGPISLSNAEIEY